MPFIRRCEAEGCSNTSLNKKRSLLEFPKDKRVETWVKNIKMKNSNTVKKYLCTEHFQESCFTNTFYRRIHKFAVPTIQSLNSTVSTYHSNFSRSEKTHTTQISNSTDQDDEPPRKVSGVANVKRLRSEESQILRSTNQDDEFPKQNSDIPRLSIKDEKTQSVVTDYRVKSTARKSITKKMTSQIRTSETRKVFMLRNFTNKIRLEICADSISSVINAASGGADRIELCQELSVGGLTPSAGFIAQSKWFVNIPIYVLIRPRSGDFCYTEPEIRIMEDDIKNSINVGAEGFVIGALTRSGEIDVEICRRLLDKTRGFPVTFHRAFDLTRDPFQALDCLVNLKFQRLLTSGQAKTALEGLPLIRSLISQTNKIVIMPGCGITHNNVKELLNNSNIQEFHSSAKLALKVENEAVLCPVVQGTSSYNITDINCVKKMRKIADIISEQRRKVV